MDTREKLLSKKETQQLLLEMLDQFTAYCEKHGLRYYLVGGTLLGAVRHQGFIPWDDDIDVGMPRPDYERFLKLVEKEPVSKDLKPVSDRNRKLYNAYCELLNTRTRLEKETSQYIREEGRILNLFIDIFPQDGWPEDDREAEKLAGQMKRLRYLALNGRARLGKGTSPLRMLAKMPVILLMKVVGSWRIVDKIDRIARKYDYDTSRYVGAITYGIYGSGERCLRTDVLPLTKVTFEGKQYYAPRRWDVYLGQIYGDFWKLPPKEKQIDHRMKVWYKE